MFSVIRNAAVVRCS
uniref:Uncharacterized protein n=1 Tax=Anguilla anguilla TaxID=7936 RepID=A0A0E9QCQ1_ANGAN